MATKSVIFTLASTMCLGWLGWVSPAICQEPAQLDPVRAETLSRKIDEIHVQLGKLDQIMEQLRRLRSEELPKLQKEMLEQAEASVLVKGGERTAQKPATDAAPQLPGEGEKSRSVPGSLEGQLENVQLRLQQLDDVAAQITALRDVDLPRLQSELARIAAGPTGEKRHQALRPVPATQGRLVITNLSGLTRDVTVNGTTYRFEPGSWQVPVPYQEVTTKLSSSDTEHLWGSSLWKQTDSGPEMRLELK